MISSRAAPKVTTRSQISAPIEPPPPVTTTDLPLQKRFQPAVVDLDARPQQQIFDRDRRKLKRRPLSSSDGSRLTVSPSRRARIRIDSAPPAGSNADGVSTSRVTGILRVAQQRDHLFEIVEAAEHRHAAHRDALIRTRRRQKPNRPDFGDCTALDRAQRHLDVRGTAKDQGRDGIDLTGPALRPRLAEIPVGDARAAEKRGLDDEIKRDGDLAEEERGVEIRRQQHVVEHQQRNRQHRGGLDDPKQLAAAR